MRPFFAFIFIMQLIIWGLAFLFLWAVIFYPELIGETVARIVNGFRQAI